MLLIEVLFIKKREFKKVIPGSIFPDTLTNNYPNRELLHVLSAALLGAKDFRWFRSWDSGRFGDLGGIGARKMDGNDFS